MTRYGIAWVGSTCLSTGKIRFRSESAARAKLAEIMCKTMTAIPGYLKQPVRAYQCEACDGWHLTAKHTSYEEGESNGS